ncbi:hypothetical protein J1N35_023856 [Gossypium stocksii]|uniref:Uncharacterized protein n=1 Tax=Gossypium stocksii TaxID=47602 RepID=A0A9D3VIT7_9ROSI|nr:hypothetical protein J1N35_023856 [Gossypium stocksii]
MIRVVVIVARSTNRTNDAMARRSLPNSWTTRLFEAPPDDVLQLVEQDRIDGPLSDMYLACCKL